ncbi:MAG: M1 family metallopeptidase [Proteobacteria bacterium]|nr:M1 family metallopeptidase [Pseudomonadota bacterium]
MRWIHGLALAALLGGAAARAAEDVPTGPLPRDVVPTLVQLDLRIDPREERFSGHTRIEATLARPLRTLWLHGRDLEITRAEAVLGDGRRLPLVATQVHPSGVLRLEAPDALPAGPLALEFDHAAAFGALEGAYRAKQAGLDYVITQMEPLAARATFPGFDEPAFKQPWELTLRVPADAVAAANTAEVGSEAMEDGFRRVRFARTEALPSYLVAFAVGPWDVAEGPAIDARGTRKAALPFRTLVPRGQAGQSAYGREHTPAIVHALEDYFGTPYPFAKLDNVAAPDFAWGAMENAGLIVYRDSLLFPDAAAPASERLSFWMVSAHELAHQWFGNLVTMRWWDDLWLNEAFANWMGYKITQQLQPDLKADAAMLDATLRTMDRDSLASTRRIGEPIREYTDIQSAFDGITYDKGGAVLGMVEHYIGEAAFRDGVRDYLAAHARGNATRGDLFASISKRAAEPDGVLATLDSFIGQPGVPELQVALDCGSATPALQVRQRRYLPVGSSADADQAWTLPMCVRYGDGEATRTQCALVSGRASRVELHEARSCPAWVMPNADARGYYRYVLEAPLQAALTGRFASLGEREQQAYADALQAGFKAGTLASSAFLAALPQLAGARSAEATTLPFVNLRWMWEQLLDDEAARDEFRARIAAIYRPRLAQLGLEPRAGDSDEMRALRETLVWVFAFRLRDPAVRAPLAAQGRRVLGLDGDGALHVDAVSRDLRANALVIALQDGGIAAFDAAERHLRGSEDPTLRGELLGAMGLVEDPALAARFRALMLDEGAVRANELPWVGGQSGIPSLRPALRTWLRANFDALRARVGPFMVQGVIAVEAIGRCDVAGASELQAHYGPIVQDFEGAPLALAQATEDIRLCAALKQAHAGQPLAFPQ